MGIGQSGNQIRCIVAPSGLLVFHDQHITSHQVQHGLHMILLAVKIAKQCLQVTVASTSSHAIIGGIQHLGIQVVCLYGVGEGTLLVVVGMDACQFAVG